MTVLSWSVSDLLDIGVNPLVVICLLLLAVIIPAVVTRIVISKKTLHCSECGANFRLKPQQIHLGFHDFNGRNAYCPHCKKITWCRYLTLKDE